MLLQKYNIKWPIVIVTALIVGLLFFWETTHLKIETDIVKSMPHDDPVLDSARRVISHLPIQDRLFLDIEQKSGDPAGLARAALLVEEKLQASGLFTKVGMSLDAHIFPELVKHVTDSLPVLFNQNDLEQKIRPLIDPEKIREAMEQNRQSLIELGGVGRSELMVRDPLNFSGVILGQMSALLPANEARFYQGRIFSACGRHTLVIAHIAGSATDTKHAFRISQLVEQCRQELENRKDLQGTYLLTPVGAYRAALDNEAIAKRDVRLAIILTVLGIALLLIVAFPRPLIGLLALLPSSVGAIASLFVCSFVFESMSMLAVGFGGAIMAFTVDLGITYLMFLDQPYATSGKKVATEVRAAEMTAALTTAGAFLLLLISDFEILAQIGVFASLGITFALLFVQIVFPRIFLSLPPARRPANRLLQAAVNSAAAPARWKTIAAVVFALVMLIFTKPVFDIDLQTMNSVSPETITAEQKIQKVWGDISGRCYILLNAQDVGQLQSKNAQLMKLLSAEAERGSLEKVFLPTVLFPDQESARANHQAWYNFWNGGRVRELGRNLRTVAIQYGFTGDAFDPFIKSLGAGYAGAPPIPEKYYEMLGITETPEGLTQLSLIPVGKNYRPGDLFERLAPTGLVDIFDADLFNQRLGEFLKTIFFKIAVIVSIGLVLVIFIFFMDWRLSLAVLAPVAFALVSTLGTLKIIGHPLDIPGIMLWVVILGMGIDYSVYYACTYQRHPEEKGPAMQTVVPAMFLSAATTFIGFGVLALARHPLLKSIGLVSLLGIGYSLAGAYLILPYLMKRIFAPFEFPEDRPMPGTSEHTRRTIARYRHLPGYPRIFARFKIKLDPMFGELDRYVKNPRLLIDIGCGWGVPATWLLELYPQARVIGLEPDVKRVLIARRVIGARGSVQTGRAPDLPDVEGRASHVLMLDMLHYLDDEELKLVLERIYEILEPDGSLLIRATVPVPGKIPWKRRIEMLHLKMIGVPERFRPEGIVSHFMKEAGFAVEVHASQTPGVEEKWFVGIKQKVRDSR